MVKNDESVQAEGAGSSEIQRMKRRTYSEEPDFDSCAGELSRPHSASGSRECFTVRGRVGVGSGATRVEVHVFVAIRELESAVVVD